MCITCRNLWLDCRLTSLLSWYSIQVCKGSCVCQDHWVYSSLYPESAPKLFLFYNLTKTQSQYAQSLSAGVFICGTLITPIRENRKWWEKLPGLICKTEYEYGIVILVQSICHIKVEGIGVFRVINLTEGNPTFILNMEYPDNPWPYSSNFE